MNNPVRTVVLSVVAFFLITTVFLAYRSVPSGHVGVKIRFARVLDEPLKPGPHFVIPWVERVVSIATQPNSYEITTSTSSKDMQEVTTTVAVQHYIDPLLASKGYAEIGDLEKYDANLISPAVFESLKAVTAEYTAEELVTKRDIVKQQTDKAIQEFVNETLKEKDVVGSLHIVNVSIKEFKFSNEFNASIEAKVKAQQEAYRAVNEKQKRITEAEATQAEKKMQTDAEAYQLEKTSIARAEAIKREAEALKASPDLLKLRAIEAWNGDVPKFIGGEVVPFINVDSETPRQIQVKAEN